MPKIILKDRYANVGFLFMKGRYTFTKKQPIAELLAVAIAVCILCRSLCHRQVFHDFDTGYFPNARNGTAVSRINALAYTACAAIHGRAVPTFCAIGGGATKAVRAIATDTAVDFLLLMARDDPAHKLFCRHVQLFFDLECIDTCI
jgi:hypothetical protein